MTGSAYYWLGTASAPAFPPVPSRAQVCRVQLSFQGLTVDIGAGPLPWFEAALCCLVYAQRQRVYAAKHAAGDTHALIFFSGGMPLYDEPNQPYQSYQAPDFEHDPGLFVALVEEVIQAGFIPAVFFDEREAESTRLMPIAIAALWTSRIRNLNQDVIYVPGFDGVFYGWPTSQIVAWGQQARALGAYYLAMEHNTAHIPLGNGSRDYAQGGMMDWCDTILSEFDPWGAGGSPGDQVWQIAARLLGPAYRRPPEQPIGDDPRPPFYLMDSPRGPRYAVAFETDTYWWVRGQVSLADVLRKRVYFRTLGYTLVC